MQRFFRSFVFFSLGTILVACGGSRRSSEPLPTNFFAGEFVYFADAPVFYDCANGLHYPVAMEGEYLKLEKQYMAFGPEMGERIWVALRAHIEYRPAMEGDGKEKALVVDAVVRFDREGSCNRSFLIAGIYQSDVEGVRSILRLRPDYTFTETIYAENASETICEGEWGRTSQADIALNYSDREEQQIYEVAPGKESLTRDDRRQQYVYKKVYVN